MYTFRKLVQSQPAVVEGKLVPLPLNVINPNNINTDRLNFEIMITNTQVTRFGHSGDCITSLHHSIISRILSRLPTKDAVQTSALSKNWRYKWTSLYNVDVEGESLIPSWKNIPFLNFMDRILLYIPHIRSFRLACYGHDLHCVLKWIDTAAKRQGLESLEVRYGTRVIIFSSKFLNNTCLRNLKLDLPCILKVAAMNFAPNLTSLYLSRVQIWSGNVKVIFNFPVLQTFEVKNCRWSNLKSMEVYAPSLTNLKYLTLGDKQNGGLLVIHGTKISNLEIYGDVPQNIIIQSSVGSASLMNQASPNLKLFRNIGMRVWKLFNSLSSLEELSLSDYMAQALQFGPPLVRHAKLRRLNVHGFYNIGHLFEVLRAMPSLNYLFIDVGCMDDYNYDCDAMESTPSCIVSHLEEVELYDFCGEESAYNLAKLLLGNGKALKKVSVILTIFDITNEVTERLDALPKCSTCCTVVVKNYE